MQVFGVFDCYIGKMIFNIIMMILFMLVLFFGIIKFVDQLKKFGQGSYDVLGVGFYIIFSVLKDIQIFFLMVVLFGVLLGLGMLVQCSELVVMQVFGFIWLQVVLVVMKIVILLVLLIMVIGEWVVLQGEQMVCNYCVQQMYGGLLFLIQQGLWVKDGYNFVYIECVKGNDELGGVSIYVFNLECCLQLVCYVVLVKFDSENKVWCLLQVDEFDLIDLKQVIGLQMVSGIWKINLMLDKLGVVVLDLDVLLISGLYNYVKYFKFSGQDLGCYQFNMWSKIFQLLLVVVMMLMVLLFIFGLLCSVLMGVWVVMGISFGFIFYVFDQIFGLLILVYGILLIIGVLLLSVSFFLISFWLMMCKVQWVSLKCKFFQ